MCEWCVPVSCHPFAARKETIESIKGEHKKKGEKSTYTMKRKPKWRYPPRAKRRPIQHKTEDNNKTQRNRTGTDGDQEEGRRGERPNADRPCEARRGKKERPPPQSPIPIITRARKDKQWENKETADRKGEEE